jgi:hypothetical protein
MEDKSQTSNDIEVTPEMIAAAVNALSRVDFRMDSYEEIARAVYVAMTEVRPAPRSGIRRLLPKE